MRLTDYRSEVIVADQTGGTILNKYDAFSRWAGQTCSAPGGAGPRPWDEVTVQNEKGGLVNTLTSIGGTVSYSYDQGSRLSSISGPAGTFNYIYNPANGLIADVSCSAISAAYTFDALDQVTDIAWKDSANNVVRGFNYGYNAVGMITQKVTTINNQPATNIYTYDNLDRLTSESISSFSLQPTAYSLFSYDLAGNRIQAVVNGQTITYTLSAGNRLVNWGVDGTNS